MKHLLIAVMIAILIGTIQAVKFWGNPFKPRTCTFDRAFLSWNGNFFEGKKQEDVTGYI